MTTLKEINNKELLEEVRERLQNKQLKIEGAFLMTNDSENVNSAIYLGKDLETKLIADLGTAFSLTIHRGGSKVTNKRIVTEHVYKGEPTNE